MKTTHFCSTSFRGFFAWAALGAIHLISLKYFQEFYLMGQEGHRWVPMVLSTLPLFFLFFLLRSFLPFKAALLGAGGIEIVLSLVHWIKIHLTNEPLVWSDFVTLWNNSVLPKYFQMYHLILIFIFSIFFVWFSWKSIQSFHLKKPLNPYFWLALLTTPFLFFPKTNILGLTYHQADWRQNVRMNGLLFHLIQTSQKTSSLLYSESEKIAFDNLLSEKNSCVDKPEKIIFILCESCWYDTAHFRNLFQPLFDRGFQDFRAVSPVYGGGTPNATFEILTGLPSITEHLNGIIYQEYAVSLSKRVYSLPQYLHKEGYRTIALHNNARTFWQRHIVNPKLGFERYIGLEEMPSGTVADWPDDGVLFSVGLEQFNNLRSSPLFFFFTTIFSHGPYWPQNDLGETTYSQKIRTSISRLSYFIDEIYKTEPNTLVFIFGDHKPALGDYLLKEGVFTSEEFHGGGRWDRIGDVPLLIKHPNAQRVKNVISQANSLPFFCAIDAIDREFIGSGLPSFTYSRQMNLCEHYSKKGYSYYKTAYPKWLYAISLFEREPKRLHNLQRLSHFGYH